MTQETLLKHLITDNLPEGWKLLNIIPLPYYEATLGSHEAVFYNKNLDLTTRLYITFTGGILRKASMLGKVLKESTEGKVTEFSDSL